MEAPRQTSPSGPTDLSRVSRRRFLRTTSALAAGAGLAPLLPRALAAPRNKGLPKPRKSGLEHFVVVMMENRSFDHFLGWLPGADGRQAGLAFTDSSGASHPVFPLAPDFQGCAYADPDHSYAGGRIQLNLGACDGWLRASPDVYPAGYYTQNDLPFLANASQAWTACDRYFASLMAPTYPNRIYQYAAQTDRLDDTLLPISTLPTIWDRLADHSLAGRYYFSDFPLLAFWGARYVGISHPVSDFFTDAAAGNLPAVSFVDPRFLGESVGISGDDHPHGDIRDGEAFLNSVYQAVTSSPNWPNTVLVINFDEWGGFFDHVAPPVGPIPASDAALGSDGRLGFRVPALVVSPWSPRGTVAHGQYDHTSVLKMIEWRWSLRPLTVRDANANNLGETLDFTQTNLDAPQFAVPPGPFGVPCALNPAAIEASQTMLKYAAGLGFPVS